jgi:hypothetical protein
LLLVIVKLLAEAAGTMASAAKSTNARIKRLRVIVRTENLSFLVPMKFDYF